MCYGSVKRNEKIVDNLTKIVDNLIIFVDNYC